MSRNKILAVVLFVCSFISGQQLSSNSIELEFNKSIHGSGNQTGMGFASNYLLKKSRFSQLLFVEGTIHDG